MAVQYRLLLIKCVKLRRDAKERARCSMTKKKGTNKKQEPKKSLPAINKENSYEEKEKEYQDLINQCLEIIKDPKYPVLFITDLVSFLPFGRTKFYKMGLDKSEVLKEAINDNKVKMKQDLRLKWYSNPNPTVQIALYKLICTDEERNAISNNPKSEESKAIPDALLKLADSINESIKAYDGDI